MTNFERVSELFLECSSRPATERATFLAAACGSDAELYEQVAAMISFDEERPDFLAAPALAHLEPEFDLPAVDRPAWIPDTIGDYRVLEQIGAGGMGLVFKARNLRTEQLVALKILRPGLDSRTYLERFRIEAKALGRLTHPGVARLYDAGEFDSPLGSQPYFVLELVEGRQLLVAASERQLDVRTKCALMAEIAEAVHEAHLRRVIHRDLKPANILVDEAGRPRVLDFGVALLSDRDLQATGLTRAGQMVGTLSYMSPEQALGDLDALDLRTDVYSLGCVFYELLCGHQAFPAGERSLAELARTIQEDEPLPLRVHDSNLRGDLETLVSKAMNKQSDFRYASAAAFAADIRRFLDFLPIEARAPSAIYQLRRFARRNRAWIVGTTIGAFAMLAAGAGTIWFVAQEREAQRHVQARAEDLQRRREFLALRHAGDLYALDQPLITLSVLEEVSLPNRGWEWSFLKARCSHVIRHVYDTEAPLWRMRMSRDNTRLACGGEAGTALLVDTREDEVLAKMDLEGQLRALDLHPDGTHLAVLVWTDEVGRLWFGEPEELAVLGEFEADRAWCMLRFSADGTTLALGWGDGCLLVFEVPSGELRARIRALGDHVFQVSPSPDGRFCTTRATGSAPAAALWDTRTGQEVARFGSHAGTKTRLMFDPTGLRVLDLSQGETLEVWERTTGQYWEAGTSVSEESLAATSVAFTNDGERFYVLGSAGRVQEYSSARQQLLREIPIDVTSPKELAISPDESLLAVSGQDDHFQIIRLEDESSWRAPARLSETSLRIDFGADNRLWSTWPNGELQVQLVEPVPVSFHGHDSYVYAVDYAWGGDLMVSASFDGTLLAWDPNSTAPVASLASGLPIIEDLEVTPDGNSALLVGHAGLIAQVDLAHGTGVKRFGSTGETWSALAVMRPGSEFVTGGQRQIVRWDLEQGVELARRETSPVSSLALHPSEDRLAVGYTDGSVQVIDSSTLAALPDLGAFQKHSETVWSLAWSPNGRFLASGGSAGNVMIHDTTTGELVTVLLGLRPAARVYALAFSPDGTRLAAGVENGRIYLWETKSWEPTLQLHAHESYVHDLVFHPGGLQLVSASGDGSLAVWDMRTPLEIMTSAAQRQLCVEALRQEGGEGSGVRTGGSAESTSRGPLEDLVRRQQQLRRLVESAVDDQDAQ